jgi:hypothetical protein
MEYTGLRRGYGDRMFKRFRALMQAAVLILVGLIGLLGMYAQIEMGNVSLAIMYGVLSPFAIALGFWVMRSSRTKSDPDR